MQSSLGGLTATRIAVAQGFALSFLQFIVYCTPALPTPEVNIKLAHDKPIYEVSAC
ncbi:MAG: hypothetical protein QXM02_07450 [Thermoproteota archaeon]